MNTQLMFSSNDQTWETPMELFQKLNNEFHFTLDVCCTEYTPKCNKFFTPESNGLIQDWSNDICWMNPPYSEMYVWMEKAYKESLKGAVVVCLIPARTDTKYWHDFCMGAAEIRFIKGRLKFGDAKNSAPFPSAIVIFNNSNTELTISSYSPYKKVIHFIMPKPIRYIDGFI